MCGIAGYSGEFEPSLLPQMAQVMAYRGPDDSGEWFDASLRVGLCHRRLSIIDLSPLGRQPMWDATNRLAIVFNGEIYNYRELRRELLDEGHAFVSQTDTEVLLNLYLRDGEAMLSRLNGMFAFAIWDRARSSLFIARDALGVKPLFYTQTDKGFLFASVLQPLLCESGVSLELNSKALLDNLTLLYVPSPSTMLSKVSKLEPGHALLVRAGRIERKWQWYELPTETPKFQGSEVEASALIRDKLETAIHRQMVSDVPVGAFLSGGLDSSALVVYARHLAKDRQLDCFTLAFRDRSWSKEGMEHDLPYARIVAKHLGVRLHVIETGPEIVKGLTDMIYYLGEPQADLSALHVQSISRQAREMGIKVLLSGTGGDDLFSGYSRHRALIMEQYWSFLPTGFRSMLAQVARSLNVNSPYKRRVAKAFRFADRSLNTRIATYFEWIDPLSRNYLLSSSIRDQLINHVNRVPLLENLEGLPTGLSPLDRMLFLEQKYFLTDHNLSYTDKMSMAESVEVRVPFLDPDLLAFAWSIPDDMKQRHGENKWILKKAMEPMLPRNVIYRPKSGFGVPLRRWFQNELRDYVNDHLTNERIRMRGLFDPAGVRRLIELDGAGKIDGSYTILTLLCIEIWCQLFLDGNWKNYAKVSEGWG